MISFFSLAVTLQSWDSPTSGSPASVWAARRDTFKVLQSTRYVFRIDHNSCVFTVSVRPDADDCHSNHEIRQHLVRGSEEKVSDNNTVYGKKK